MEKENDLREAAQRGEVATVQKLLDEGVEQIGDLSGDTPLLLATSCYITDPKYVEVVRSLLDAGADVNHRNKFGNAAIHNAASRGHLEIVELLLRNKADIEVEGELQMVPLGLAATKNQHAVVNILVKKLVDDQMFSEKQMEWMRIAENDMQQLHVYRALVGIFQEKEALKSLIGFGAMSAILKGIKRFEKITIYTSGLQLLQVCMETEEGLAQAKVLDIGVEIDNACRGYEKDAVIGHLIKTVKDML